MSSMEDLLTQLIQEVQEVRRRQSQMIRRGTVHALRKGGNEMQIRYGTDDDGQPLVGPWVPVSGGNGTGSKTRHAYTVGEHVMSFNPDGDWEGAEVHPSNHHQGGQSPSQAQGEHVIHDGGGVRIAVRDGKLTQTAGGVTTVLSSSGWETTGGTMKHDGKNVGSSHTHGGVEAGSGQTAGPEA